MTWTVYLVAIIGFSLGVIGITLFLLSQKEVKNLIIQLEQINERETNQQVQVGSSNKLYRQLAIKVNQLISDKKEIQKEYIRMERELRETIANLSHDLRTPLTSMIGYLQLLEKEGLEIEKKKQYLKIVQGRAGNLKDLVENFYELSQLSNGVYKMEYQEIHLDRMFCELITNFYQDFVDKNLNLQIHVDKHLPSICGDEKATMRILLNLIQNTLRYAKKNIEINISQESEGIKLTIVNEAGNLRSEDVPCLFDRFFMVNRVRNGEGTGVGLAVVKKLAAMMDAVVGAQLIDDQLAIWITFINYKGKNK